MWRTISGLCCRGLDGTAADTVVVVDVPTGDTGPDDEAARLIVRRNSGCFIAAAAAVAAVAGAPAAVSLVCVAAVGSGIDGRVAAPPSVTGGDGVRRR